MNRTIKATTVKAFHHNDVESLKAHVLALVTAYNLAKHLTALRCLKPFRSVCDAWATVPQPSR